MKPQNIPFGKIDKPGALGTMVRAQRRVSGITQAEAAGLAGVGIRFLSELERGKSTVALHKVMQVLSRLGLDLWLVPRGQKPPAVGRS